MFFGLFFVDIYDDVNIWMKCSGFIGLWILYEDDIFDFELFDIIVFWLKGDGRVYVFNIWIENWIGGLGVFWFNIW